MEMSYVRVQDVLGGDVPPMPLSHVRPEQDETLGPAPEADDSGIEGSAPGAFEEKFESFLPR